MKNVELARERIIRGQDIQLRQLRVHLSSLDCRDALPHLEGKERDKLLVAITDLILQHIGHEVAPFAKDGRTQSSKAVKR